jgi:hypothetical protein
MAKSSGQASGTNERKRQSPVLETQPKSTKDEDDRVRSLPVARRQRELERRHAVLDKAIFEEHALSVEAESAERLAATFDARLRAAEDRIDRILMHLGVA